MRLVALTLGFLCAVPGAFAQGDDLARRTLACHESFKKHAGAGRYEVWEKDGLIFARSTFIDRSANGKLHVQLSFTDGDKVYAAKIPSPTFTDSAGVQRQSFYYEEHKARLSFPDGKSYCVNYRPQLGADQLRQYERSPPAACANEPVIAVAEVKGEDAASHLDHIHTRLSDGISLAVHLSEQCKARGRCDRDKPEEKLAGFTGAACRDLRGVASSLRQLETYAGRYGNSVNEGVAGQGAAPGDGVQ